MKAASPVHPPEDVHRGGVVCELHFLPPEWMESIRLARVAHWQAYHAAEVLHKKRSLAYQAKWKRRWRRRQRAVQMRERAGQATAAVRTVARLVCLFLMIATAACVRCGGQLIPDREGPAQRCLSCGHVEYAGGPAPVPDPEELTAEKRATTRLESAIRNGRWDL